MTRSKSYYVSVFITWIAIAVLFNCVLYLASKAHPPCEEDYQPPQCSYVQVVNPITGLLEQRYVCE